MGRTWMWLALLVVASPALGKKPKKPKKGAEPLIGWQQQEGWSASCYYPVNFEALGTGERRIARQDALEEMMTQWGGTREDGVSFNDTAVVNVETTMLGRPELIETVAVENLAQCEAAMKGGGVSAWSGWFNELAPRLNVGQCKGSLMPSTLYDYLNIGAEWQIPARLCKGDKVKVRGSDGDYYRIADGGPWINVEGDTSQKASGDLPCTLEGCFPGQLILRFTADDGVTSIVPIGGGKVFTAPDHGKIQVMINDNSWFDNVYKTENRVTHHTGIEYSPAEKGL